jgi:hypothetical protein
MALGLGSLAEGLGAEGLDIKPSFEVEIGAIKIFTNTYRVGAAPANNDFDYVSQGGQEILFPFSRLSAAFLVQGRHDLRFIYQPFEVSTEVNFPQSVTVDNTVFSGPTRLTYGFPFYRATYQYRFLADGASWLAAGAAIQLRNASIRFASLDGLKLTVSQNLGVVPALAVSGRRDLGRGWFLSFDATGIYASSAFFNGASFQFEGSILDASARIGFPLSGTSEAFLNARFFGGSAKGISQYARSAWSNSVSPEAANYLSTATFTIGATVP